MNLEKKHDLCMFLGLAALTVYLVMGLFVSVAWLLPLRLCIAILALIAYVVCLRIEKLTSKMKGHTIFMTSLCAMDVLITVVAIACM